MPLASQYGMGKDISPSLLEIHNKSSLVFSRSQLWLDSFQKIVNFQLVRKNEAGAEWTKIQHFQNEAHVSQNYCFHCRKFNIKHLLLCCDVFSGKQNTQHSRVMDGKDSG